MAFRWRADYGQKLKAGLVALRFSGDRDPYCLKSDIFVIFEGVRTPCPPSGSHHALYPPMCNSRANVLLIFQCPGICLTPSQVDILVSDDSLDFAQLYVTDFLLG